MKKLIIKKVFESKKAQGNLALLCNIRDAIFYQNKKRKDNHIDIFRYNFKEIEIDELFRDEDRIYVIQTASNKFIEVDKEDMENFE